MRRFEAHVFGDVQGVSFRAFVAREARARGITGTTSNTADGSVKVVAEGETHGLEAFLLQLRAGPRFARVEKVEAVWSDATGAFADFGIM